MPRANGKGPRGQGPGTGKGNKQSIGRGRGRKGGLSTGPGGYCVCPDCGERVTHKIGVPCFNEKCPGCGAVMNRE